MIDRYKKRGGFLQLLTLIETTEKAKAEKFLAIIKEESPLWEQEIRNKVLSMDKISKWDTKFLMEVLPRLTPNVIGCAINPLPPEQRENFLKGMDFSERRKAEEYLKEAKPNVGEISASQMKIISEIRKAVAEGVLKLEKVDPMLGVPDNIEEILSSAGSAQGSPQEHLVPADAAEATSSSLDNAQTGTQVPSPSALPSEETLALRRKVMALSQENLALKNQVQALQHKLDAIRKAAA
jgi:hypothetical protein